MLRARTFGRAEEHFPVGHPHYASARVRLGDMPGYYRPSLAELGCCG